MGKFKSIAQYSPRSLSVVAAYLAGRDVEVVVSPRVKYPLVVALKSATLVLDPGRAGLYEVLLGAMLLRRRQEARISDEDPGAERRISVEQARQWSETARRELEQAMPGVRRLAGWEMPGGGRKPPKIVWSKVPWNRLDLDSFTVGVGQRRVSGVSLETARGDYRAFLAALRQGQCPLRRVEGLSMPVADMPLTISTSESPGPDFERLEALLAENEDTQRFVANCYQRKSEGLSENQLAPRRMHTGTLLDTARLAQAVASSRGGDAPRVFRRRHAEYQPIFNPQDHLVVCGFDVHSFEKKLSRRAANPTIPAVAGNVFRRLGVDLAMTAFNDWIVKLGDGRDVYIHTPVVIKAFDEGFEASYFNRLASFVFGRLCQTCAHGGMPAAFAPLQLESLRAISQEVSKRFEHPVTTMLYFNAIGMAHAGREHTSPAVRRRTADLVDEILDQMRAIDFAGRRLDAEFMYMPREIVAAANPSGHVAKMITL